MRAQTSTLVLVAFVLMCGGPVSAQESETVQLSGELARISEPGSTTRWLKISEGVGIPVEGFFTQFGRDLGLSNFDSLALTRLSDDRYGFTRKKFQQYFMGIEVQGATYLLHEKSGIVQKANGHIVPDLERSIIPDGAKIPIDFAEAAIVERFSGKSASTKDIQEFLSEPELVIASPHVEFSYNPDDWFLTYRFYVLTADRTVNEYVFVDVKTGRIIKTLSMLTDVCDPAQGTILYIDEAKTFKTAYSSFYQQYGLYNECVSTFNGKVYSRNFSESGTHTDILSSSQQWTSNADGFSAHWAGEQTLDYFYSAFTRRSYDGASSGSGNTVNILVNWTEDGGTPVHNAQWDGQYLKFGSSYGNDWVNLEVVGHEYTHAVADNTSQLENEGEAGALDESFGDIFGEMVERHALGSNDWVLTAGVSSLRDMSDPHSMFDPDTYGSNDSYWLSPNCQDPEENDNCGIHTNCSVHNYWFYLLAEGGSGTNSNGDSYNVSGIGTAHAAQIAYVNLTEYLTENSDFSDARHGSIWAAEDIFGNCTNQQEQTANAWDAVGVFAAPNPGIEICSTFVSVTWSTYWPTTVSAGSCFTFSTCNIEPSSDVTFSAGIKVTLRPGFHAKNGSTFNAFIIPDCTREWDKQVVRYSSPEPTDHRTTTAPSELQTLLVSPNPARDNVHVQYINSDQGTCKVTVNDVRGSTIAILVDEIDHQAGTFLIDYDCSSLPDGTYYVVIHTGDGQSQSTKLVLVR